MNYPGSGDMYSKGANMLHTLRQMVNNDEKWREILRGLNKTYYHQTVKAEQIEDYISKESGLDLDTFFDQYLRETRIPTLEYAFVNDEIQYRWTNCVDNFNMNVKVYINGEMKWLKPSQQWKKFKTKNKFKSFEVDKDFYVAVFPISIIK